MYCQFFSSNTKNVIKLSLGFPSITIVLIKKTVNLNKKWVREVHFTENTRNAVKYQNILKCLHINF